MNAAVRVSVVMGVYNEVVRVESAIRSILGQSLREIELIVVDDGSRDGSGDLLDRLAMSDPRLRIIHQENAGLTRALVRGCAEARGDYIARQDADDWSHPQRLAEQAALLDADERLGFVSCATQYIGPEGEPLVVMRRLPDPVLATQGLLQQRQGPPAHGSVMFRRSLYEQVGGYRTEFRYSQDSDLWLRMGEVMLIGYLGEIRYVHRKDTQSISGARRIQQSAFARLAHASRAARIAGRTDADELAAARALSDEALKPLSTDGRGRNDGSSQIAYLIGSQLAINGDRRARRYLWQVISDRPWHWRAWVRLLQTLLPRRAMS